MDIMETFWESQFRDEGTMWGFEPADSAIETRDFFLGKNIRTILIPGSGYGRNVKIFLEAGFDVTGIEISAGAIDLAKRSGIDFPVHHGSVTKMPFDQSFYQGIFCYALVHLLNSHERKAFLKHCYDQLAPGGYMVFTVVSKKSYDYGTGRLLSADRYRIRNGLNVFFYDAGSVKKEFGPFGFFECREILEPIKFMKDAPPLSCMLVRCIKNNH
jgi:SAM-dependent methyltransferase